jgi:hypothetical protein
MNSTWMRTNMEILLPITRCMLIKSKRELSALIRKEKIRNKLSRTVAIGDFFVEKGVFSLRFRCDFYETKGICCQYGCYIRPEEKIRIYGARKEIAEYLRDRPELPFWKTTRGKWTFVDPKTEKGQYHVRVFNDRCIFHQTSGACAIHTYCLDNNIPLENFKFSICTTWPLDIHLRDLDQKGLRWHVFLFNGIDSPEWDDCACIRLENRTPSKDVPPSVIESLKSVIISRIGLERYAQLVNFAKTYKMTRES